MAGRRSKKMMEELSGTAPVEEIVSIPGADEAPAAVEAVSAAPTPVDAPYEAHVAVDRIAELEAEVARLTAINAALLATANDRTVIEGWPESVAPRMFGGDYKGDFVVNPSGARGVMVLEGVLFVRAPGSAYPTRLTPGGYAMIAKGQPHAIEAAGSPVRAVFVESSRYSETLEKYKPADPVIAVPTVSATEAWTNAPATAQTFGAVDMAQRPPAPQAPIPVAVQSKAVTQLMEMRRAKSKRGYEVRHPNDRMAIAQPPTANQLAGLHPSGAPMPVADGAPAVFTGDKLVS